MLRTSIKAKDIQTDWIIFKLETLWQKPNNLIKQEDMLVNGKSTQTLNIEDDTGRIFVIDQRKLPFELVTLELTTSEDAFLAIKDMIVRGAPLIGVTAAFGFYLGLKEISKPEEQEQYIDELGNYLKSARPTAD